MGFISHPCCLKDLTWNRKLANTSLVLSLNYRMPLLTSSHDYLNIWIETWLMLIYQRDGYNLETYWNSFMLLVDTNTKGTQKRVKESLPYPSAHLVIKKQLGSFTCFFRTVHSCAGILKALKLSSIILVSKEAFDRLFYEPSTRNYILPRFRGWKGWSWGLSHSALSLYWNCQPEHQPWGLW